MKGIIFVKLNEFVDQTWGLALWETLLQSTTLPSQGIYTSVATYNDQELFDLIGALCEQTSLHPDDAQFAFGRWLFKELHAAAPTDVHQYPDVFTFLRGVQDVIHVEVKKLNPDVLLPEFDFLEETKDSITFRYRSPRKMVKFCEGLLYGLADFVNQKVKVTYVSDGKMDNSDPILKVEKEVE